MGPSPVGAVVLDIGADVGALVIYVPAACQGREVDITGTDGKRSHSAVRERVLEYGSIYCLVYPSLTEGEYTIWTDETTRPARRGLSAAKSPNWIGPIASRIHQDPGPSRALYVVRRRGKIRSTSTLLPSAGSGSSYTRHTRRSSYHRLPHSEVPLLARQVDKDQDLGNQATMGVELSRSFVRRRRYATSPSRWLCTPRRFLHQSRLAGFQVSASCCGSGCGYRVGGLRRGCRWQGRHPARSPAGRLRIREVGHRS